MGVKGLWKALEPVGRRVDIATLRGKVVAVDVSIWLMQFISAMKDDAGNILPGAHILGMIRRICKLLFNRVRPIFVFDGGAPELKRRVLEARRLHRHRQAERTRATAHKLLLKRLLERKRREASARAEAEACGETVSSPAIVDLTEATATATAPGDAASEISSDSDSDGIDAGIALRGHNIDMNVMEALPIQKQYEAISKARYKRRRQDSKRAQLLPASGNPALYSQLQLQGFLKDCKAEKKLQSLEKKLNERGGDRRKIMSDPSKQYVMHETTAAPSPMKLVVDIPSGEKGKNADGSTAVVSSCAAARSAVAVHSVASGDGSESSSGEEVEEEDMIEWDADSDEEDAAHGSSEHAMISAAVANSLATFSREQVKQNKEKQQQQGVVVVDDSSDESTEKVDEAPIVATNIAAASEQRPLVAGVSLDDSSQLSGVPVLHAPQVPVAEETFAPPSVAASAADSNSDALLVSVSASAAPPPIPAASTGDVPSFASLGARVVQTHTDTPSVVDLSQGKEERQEESERPIPSSEAASLEFIPRQSVYAESANASSEAADRYDAFSLQQRQTDKVDSLMKEEVIELLELFGLSYVLSPMEAEAQCAAMEIEGIVEGVITDDADAFLFGARTVYRNIFSESKWVEMYKMGDVENECGMTRECMIRMALLLGSDYTVGVRGIGIVNAMEIQRAFTGERGLHDFRDWVHKIQSVSAEDLTPKKKKRRTSRHFKKGDSGNEEDVRSCAEKEDDDEAKRAFVEYERSHRNIAKSWMLSDGFPSAEAVNAYLNPSVCEVQAESLLRREPDIDGIRRMCALKLGWNQRVTDDLILAPIRESMKTNAVQLSLEPFLLTYEKGERASEGSSKRLKRAVEHMKDARKRKEK